jgi:hypothetical protein
VSIFSVADTRRLIKLGSFFLIIVTFSRLLYRKRWRRRK